LQLIGQEFLYFQERLEFDNRARRLRVTSGNVTLKESFQCTEDSEYWEDPVNPLQTKFRQVGKLEDKLFGQYFGSLVESFAAQLFSLYGQKEIDQFHEHLEKRWHG